MAQEEAVISEQSNGVGSKVASFVSFKPQLVIPAAKAEEAVKFYKAAFGAEELSRVNHPKRKAEQDIPLIVSALLQIGGSTFLISDQIDDQASEGERGGFGIIFNLETEDVVSAVAKAVEAGAVADGEIAEVEGSAGVGLLGRLKDPFGFVWIIVSAEKKSCETEA